ncbi:MAG TPA: aspartate 1-decarboxylase [Armatimonadota bacterium]|nr:aspartate 1-decarboxylase [Armatimonadota bacterium]
MMRFMAKSKVHGLRITDTVLRYSGSLTLDADLMAAADMVPGERVQIVNINNGSRVETYLIEGDAGSGVCALNGPAARSGEIGDPVHVISYCMMDADEDTSDMPMSVHVDENNRPVA